MTPYPSIGVSPFEILYAESPQLAINSVLLPDDKVFQSAEAYVKPTKPKLAVFHQLAMQNSKGGALRDNARFTIARPKTRRSPSALKFSFPTPLFERDNVLSSVSIGVDRIW